MLLRRIIAHFRKQQWTAIGIDFAIVVIGVFIATQVADWSAGEADKRRGRVYLKQLTADIQQDHTGLEWIGGYYDEVFEGAVRAKTLLEQPNPDPSALVINASVTSRQDMRTSTAAIQHFSGPKP